MRSITTVLVGTSILLLTYQTSFAGDMPLATQTQIGAQMKQSPMMSTATAIFMPTCDDLAWSDYYDCRGAAQEVCEEDVNCLSIARRRCKGDLRQDFDRCNCHKECEEKADRFDEGICHDSCDIEQMPRSSGTFGEGLRQTQID